MPLQALTNDELLEYKELIKTASKREIDVKINGFSTKYAYHLVRLMDEVEQILQDGDINLERDRERLKSIRRGEWTLERLELWFQDKEIALEKVYESSTIPHSADEETIRDLLIECLELHYGDLKAAVVIPPDIKVMIGELEAVIEKYGRRL